MIPLLLTVLVLAGLSGDQDPGRLHDGSNELVVQGTRLWYRVAGHASPDVSPVLFLHGGPGYNSHSFATLAGPDLERELRMIYLDQRGCGRSERPSNGPYGLDILVADIESLRVALGVPRFSVIGHSFGGTLALEYAAAHPDRVDRVVLVSAAADLPAACQARVSWLSAHHPVELDRARSTLGTGAAATDCALAFGTLSGNAFAAYNNAVMFPDSSVRARQDSVDAASGLANTGELARALFDAGLFTYRFARPGALRMPVLVLAGRFDHAIGLEPQRALAGMLPNARFEEYERSGHFLYLDEPERFAVDVTRFLATPAGAPGEDGVTLASLPPSVVRTVPQCGDEAVPPGLREISVTFSKEMKVTGHCWSWCGVREDTFPVRTAATRFLEDRRTCVLSVALEPARTYAIWINTEQYRSFQDPDGHPAVPYLLVFRTTSSGEPSDEVREPASR